MLDQSGNLQTLIVCVHLSTWLQFLSFQCVSWDGQNKTIYLTQNTPYFIYVSKKNIIFFYYYSVKFLLGPCCSFKFLEDALCNFLFRPKRARSSTSTMPLPKCYLLRFPGRFYRSSKSREQFCLMNLRCIQAFRPSRFIHHWFQKILAWREHRQGSQL